jgi:hypothetical protein
MIDESPSRQLDALNTLMGLGWPPASWRRRRDGEIDGRGEQVSDAEHPGATRAARTGGVAAAPTADARNKRGSR